MIKTIIRYLLPFIRVSTLVRRRGTSSRHRHRPFFIFEERTYTYAEVWEQAVRYAHWFARVREELGIPSREQLPIAAYMENRPEFLFAYFGAALTGDVLYAVNTGFRGDVLAGVLAGAGARLLITEPKLFDRLEPALDQLSELDTTRHLAVASGEGDLRQGRPLDELAGTAPSAKPPKCKVVNTAPSLVIYTSGTTGLPKGVVCSQWKLTIIGQVLCRKIGLTRDDRGYVVMPLFHSNAFFLGIMPLLVRHGSFYLRRKFSASGFEEDILEHGCTYMNYVGQPIHYILAALEEKYGSAEAIEAALARHPKNRFRIAVGNGASGTDRRKLLRYLGMDHIYELYGSTEAAISTFNMPGDPTESVGKVTRGVTILNERDEECPPGIVKEGGLLTNYSEAVGEICRKLGRHNIFFDGYHSNQKATSSKYRDGYYRSGDLGHVRVVKGKRYLYFNGRTDDWIRKDGENFSAASVAEVVSRHPRVALAAAYGAPCAVSDERVMVAVQLEGQDPFDPQEFHDFLIQQQASGGMDPKWMPDYLRVVDEFEMTGTQKIVVRPLKAQHFNVEAHPEMEVYHLSRGDTVYRPLDGDAFETQQAAFAKNGREALLQQY